MHVKILAGQPAMLNPHISSAIDKRPVNTRQFCSLTGLSDDTQVSGHFHGGPERALHYYPREHYDFWRSWFQGMGLTGSHALLAPGAFGENISGTGLQETEACIGDIYRLDQALIQISQPRSPCYKLNARFGYDFFSVLVQANGRTGWLLRVLEEGEVSPEAEMTLVDRPCPQMPVRRVGDIVFNQAFERSALQELVESDCLSVSWREKAAAYLAEGRVSDWSLRLLGPK
ncbi:MOSC domain-containing protein [Oceanisphaera arctica]|uniref:MOSC domain-containing protein n=1 Tax=Oceanisphaera arctica TaxID=641510 RepID=A0A2P5TNQ6_9GAMM|nr:MOSC domain-containing protein [Oceanisphaera arctica]PPL17243.1 MOSC domain-containing protein [Oceanisphaera arctica]GHA20305.1 molybdenum cofactor sulfurase [Oceanisphaera arctica]